jgi:hypothetical protein
MKKFFTRNLTTTGRLVRFGLGCGFFAGAAAAWFAEFRWLAGLLGVGGAFIWFEAARGWCVARACGVKTRW